MTGPEYRQDDRRDEGFCPLCGASLANYLTVAGEGYCERHGWVSADWTPRTASGSDDDEGDDTP